jgi:flagellar biosynthesis/type III secretory pathway protein FliH
MFTSGILASLYCPALTKNQIDDLVKSTPMNLDNYLESIVKEKYKVEIEQYKLKCKNAQDEALERAIEIGLERGLEIGIEKGIVKGKNIALVMVAKNMLKNGKSLKEVIETLNVSLKWLDKFV